MKKGVRETTIFLHSPINVHANNGLFSRDNHFISYTELVTAICCQHKVNSLPV